MSLARSSWRPISARCSGAPGSNHDFADGDRERIFHEHLAYTLGLLASGDQLAAGPVPDGPAEAEVICGLGLYQKESVAEVRGLLEQDPGVRQGLYTFDVMTWQTPKGSLAFPLSARP